MSLLHRMVIIAGWTEVDREHFDDVVHVDAPYVALVLKP